MAVPVRTTMEGCESTSRETHGLDALCAADARRRAAGAFQGAVDAALIAAVFRAPRLSRKIFFSFSRESVGRKSSLGHLERIRGPFDSQAAVRPVSASPCRRVVASRERLSSTRQESVFFVVVACVETRRARRPFHRGAVSAGAVSAAGVTARSLFFSPSPFLLRKRGAHVFF